MGFAPGCAAVAMPRRRGAFMFLGYALWLNQSPTAKLGPGHSPETILAAVSGAEPPPHIRRRHSRSQAVALFEAKLNASLVSPR